MTIKSLFGFSVTPENLTPTPVLVYICITVVSVPFLLVVIVTYKCKQKKNIGSKNENKTAERNSTEALSSGETENDNKRSEVRKAQSQKDEEHEKQEVEKKMKAETLKANEIEGNESETQSQDVKAEVRMVEDQNEGNENLQTTNKDLKTDNAELQLSKSDEVLKKTKPEPEKQSVEISTPKEELEKNEEMTPDMLKKKQKTSSLKLALAVTRINKLEDTVDQFFSGKNQSMETELDNLKRTLQAKEKELETFKWLRNYLINEIPESFSQLKFELAISRVQKLEDKVEELLHGKDQSKEKDLQILKWKLEAKEKEAAALKLGDEHQTEEGDEKNLQTLENNSPNHVVNEEVAVAQQQLQGEEQRRADDELEKNEEMTPDMLKKKQKTSSLKLALAVTRINKLEDTVDQFFSGKNQSMETELDNLKRMLQAKEKELETFKWLRNYLINEIPESFSQLKFELAISRVQKLEDKVEELLHGKDQSNDKDLQILKWKLKAKEEEEAAALKLGDEHQTEEGDEKNLQTLENNSPNHVVDAEVSVAQQQLQDEEQCRADDELNKTEVMAPDTLKEKQEASSQLNLSLAVTTRNKSPLSCDPDDLLKVIEKMDAELKMKDNDVQMLKKELETNKKQIHQPSIDHEDTSQTIDELKKTQNLLEEKNAEIRTMWKQFKNTLNEEKQRNKEDLNFLKKELEAQNKKLEIKVSEVQQQLKDEQQSREAAEKDVQTLKDELENKNKELQESKCQFESLTEVSQTSERQLSELKERYKEEFKKKIRAEKERRKEVEEDVKSLKQELENKINQLQKAKEEPEEAVKECDISGHEHLVPTEPTKAPDN